MTTILPCRPNRVKGIFPTSDGRMSAEYAFHAVRSARQDRRHYRDYRGLRRGRVDLYRHVVDSAPGRRGPLPQGTAASPVDVAPTGGQGRTREPGQSAEGAEADGARPSRHQAI